MGGQHGLFVLVCFFTLDTRRFTLDGEHGLVPAVDFNTPPGVAGHPWGDANGLCDYLQEARKLAAPGLSPDNCSHGVLHGISG